jgi:hypothetical protein
MASNIFGSDSSSALPGGNMAKPLMIALLALLASRYFGKKGADQTATPEPQPAPRIPQADPANASPGDLLDGRAVLLEAGHEIEVVQRHPSRVERAEDDGLRPDALMNVPSTISPATGRLHSN